MDPGTQRSGCQASPLVERSDPVAGQRAQHGLVIGVARVQGAQTGGHHPAPPDGAGVVDDGLHDLFVQARLVGLAAQDVGEIAARFGEQVVALEAATHHVHHGDDVDGRQDDVDHRPHPRPYRRGRHPRPLCELVDDVGAVGPDR
ncbi:hypothetical protein [Streptomyces sp. NPDC054887]